MKFDKEKLARDVLSTTRAIEDLLQKSGMMPAMKKADDDNAELPSEMPQDSAGADADQPAPQDEPAPENAELAPDQDDDMDDSQEMAQHLASMSDDDLHMMLEMIQSEMVSRSAPQDQDQPAPQDAAPVAADPSMEKSMDMKLQKSMEPILAGIEKLTGVVAQLNTKVTEIEKARNKPVSKATPARPSEALQKSGTSVPAVERLSKSETANHLLNQLRQGNRMVNSELMVELNLAQTQTEVNAIQDRLSKLGMKF